MTIRERWERRLMPNYATPRLTIARGRGCRVWDERGREYLDFIAGLAVVSTGHAHPHVVAALREQAGRLLHVSNLYATDEAVSLAERLSDRTGYERVFFCNSGGEANEFALKLVRRNAVRNLGVRDGVILAATNSFHGRTLATTALTGQAKYQTDYDPLPPGFRHVPFNDEATLAQAFEDPKVVGIFLELVQGEGGVVPATPAYVRLARKLASERGALLVADEVQTGVGRTGTFLAQERYRVEPDVTTLAKGLASGVPIGAALVREELAPLMAPGDHGCTFGGNPLACAAAIATLDVLDAEGLLRNAQERGGELRWRLAEAVPGLEEVRGLGLLSAIAFEAPIAKRVLAVAEEAGLLVGGLGERALRLAPPLVVTSDEIEEATGVLAKAVRSATPS